jgi:N-acetylneuraminic acid mutarotase
MLMTLMNFGKQCSKSSKVDGFFIEQSRKVTSIYGSNKPFSKTLSTKKRTFLETEQTWYKTTPFLDPERHKTIFKNG